MRKSVSANLNDTVSHLQKAKENYARQQMGTRTIQRIAANVIGQIERADRPEAA